MRRLAALLKIRPGEGEMVALVTILMFFSSAGGAIGSPGIEALFFSRFGVQFLPHMYIALGIATVIASLGITALLPRLTRSRLYLSLPLILGALLVGARLLISFDPTWFYPPLWLGMNLTWTLVSLFTWGLAALVCDTRQAKRLFPLFGVGGILGLTLGGLLTEPLVGLLGTENLLLVWAASFGLAFLVGGALLRYAHGEPGRSRLYRPPGALEEIRQGYRFVRRSPLLRWMAVAAVLFAVLFYSIGFPFAKAVAAQFPDEADLTGFLGVFNGLASGVMILTSLFLANRFYARLGFMAAIMAHPIIYLIGFLTSAFYASFSVLVGFRFVLMVWGDGIADQANQAMYNVVPARQREQARSFVRGVANQMGISLVGVILLLGERALRPQEMFLLAAAVALATTVLVWQARRNYGPALVQALRMGLPRIFFSDEQPFGGFPRDSAATAQLLAGLQNEDAGVRRVSAEMLANVKLPQSVDHIVAALDDEDPEVRAALVRALERAEASPALLEVLLLLQDPEPGVRRQAIRTLHRLAAYPQGVSVHLEPHLSDEEPAVRSAAAAALLSLGEHQEAERVLQTMAAKGSLEERRMALEALVEADSPQALLLAVEALKDPDPAVRRAAATTLGRCDAQKSAPPLLLALGDEDQGVRAAAAAALGQIGAPVLRQALAALEDPKTEEGALLALSSLPVSGAEKKLRAYAVRKVERALSYHLQWRQVGNSDGQGAGERLLADSLRHKAHRLAVSALQAARLLGDREAIDTALANLDSPHAERQANALETLETVRQAELVRPLLALWETPTPEEQPTESPLAALFQDEDPWLRAAAAAAARKRPDPAIKAGLEALARDDPDPFVQQTALQARNSKPSQGEHEAFAALNGDTPMDTIPTLSLMDRILCLRQVPIFAGLPPQELKTIATIAQEYHFLEGEHLAVQGEMGYELFIIVSGEVGVIFEEADGSRRELARRGEGDYVGEMAIISHAPRMATLTAYGDVHVLSLEQKEFEAILRLHPDTSLAVMRELCERIKDNAELPQEICTLSG